MAPTSLQLVVLSFDNAVLLETLRTMGAAGHCPDLLTTADPGAGGRCRYLRHCHRLASPSEVLAQIAEGSWAKETTLLLPLDEGAVLWVAERRETLAPYLAVGLTAPPEHYRTGIHKARLAHLLAKVQLPHPPTWFSSNWQEIDEVTFPVIVKPVDLSFGAGLEICSDPTALESAIQTQQTSGHDFVVQKLIPGYDIDCSVFCVKGEIRAWTIQREVEKEEAFSPASTVEFVDEPQVLESVRALMRLLQWEGVAHIDLRFDAARDAFLILEINGRFWGSLLASAAAGVNFVEHVVAHWQNAPAPVFEQRPIRFRSRGWGLKGLLRGQLNWGETMLPYMLRDPLPEWARIRLE